MASHIQATHEIHDQATKRKDEQNVIILWPHAAEKDKASRFQTACSNQNLLKEYQFQFDDLLFVIRFSFAVCDLHPF